jgi:hypothetical protein
VARVVEQTHTAAGDALTELGDGPTHVPIAQVLVGEHLEAELAQ